MGRRGRKRQLAVEDEYWKLLLSGVGTVAACRQVGITRKTGYRWRAERGGLPPLRQREDEHGTRYLSLLERQRIATLGGQGLTVREVARRLGRAASTVRRELHRNTATHDSAGYDADLAHARCRERAKRTRPGRLAMDGDLRAVVQAKLELEWSPQQIAGWLRLAHQDRPSWLVCHETIYQALYHGGRGGLSRELTRKLRTGRPLRKRRRRAHERSTRFIAPGLLIDARPEEAHLKLDIGHWEGDLIVGSASRSAIGTLVDRRSKYLKLVHLPVDHTAQSLVVAATAVLIGLPQSARTTLTWDQGSEMAAHDKLAPMFTAGIFFAHAGKPWQRALNENSNGLLRQYFPKNTDLRRYTAQDLAEVEDRLNNRPRKTLKWLTPAQVFHAEIAFD